MRRMRSSWIMCVMSDVSRIRIVECSELPAISESWGNSFARARAARSPGRRRLRRMRRLLFAPLVGVSGGRRGRFCERSGEEQSEVARCLDYYAQVSTVAVPPAVGWSGLWCRRGSAMGPRCAPGSMPRRPLLEQRGRWGAFNWNATRRERRVRVESEAVVEASNPLKFCITPVQAQRIACSYPVVPGVPEVKPQRCLVHRPRASTQPTRTTTVHSVLVAQGGRG